jgi:hypothetical protein
VFTARYALSPYIKQIRFVFKGLKQVLQVMLTEGRGETECRSCTMYHRLRFLAQNAPMGVKAKGEGSAVSPYIQHTKGRKIFWTNMTLFSRWLLCVRRGLILKKLYILWTHGSQKKNFFFKKQSESTFYPMLDQSDGTFLWSFARLSFCKSKIKTNKNTHDPV